MHENDQLHVCCPEAELGLVQIILPGWVESSRDLEGSEEELHIL